MQTEARQQKLDCADFQFRLRIAKNESETAQFLRHPWLYLHEAGGMKELQAIGEQAKLDADLLGIEVVKGAYSLDEPHQVILGLVGTPGQLELLKELHPNSHIVHALPC